jgi:hypothetical protein
MPAPGEIVDLVTRFAEQVDAYNTGHYNETQLRRDYLDGFLKALGWDVDNSQGFAEAYREVIHEDAIRIGSHLKSPDYSCRVGGQRKFFVEAKKPSVDIKQDAAPAYQLRRYAWSAKLPLSILTNFEELSVYDCRIKPILNDKASVARIRYWTYKDFIDQWDEIAAVFSKTAVLKGSFDKYAITTKGKKGTAQVDDAFLDEIENWRLQLAKDFARLNAGLSQQDLNWSVQQTIDRIIFLRIAEDRGLEPYAQLQGLNKGRGVYAHLTELFKKADDRYNSGLFHFNAESGRHEEPDRLTPKLKLGDDTLKQIFSNLYYPESPYEFSVLGADILGNVYERFLGKVIRLTAGHQAKVEEKPEVKKAGGVYYTPTYIVDYIVKKTVGTLLEGKTPAQAASIRILDPACGSGSFLIAVYQFMLDWHRDFYLADGADRHSRGKSPKLRPGRGGGLRLTTAERKRILTSCIFGVDIDAQAVEVTKLSLLLKVLEGETQLEIFHERVLPDLGDNIKCGNSLIGSDFYAQPDLPELDEDSRRQVNVFDWDGADGFRKIVRGTGFDVVLGNPPWGASFTPEHLEYLRNHYGRVIARTIDSYIYFIDRATTLVSANGQVGFIVPSTILNQSDALPVRELLLGRGISQIVSLGQGIFGRKVLNTSSIIVSRKMADADDVIVGDLSQLPIELRAEALRNVPRMNYGAWRSQVAADSARTFFTGSTDRIALLQRLRKLNPPLVKALLDGIARGVSPDIAAAHVMKQSEASAAGIERKLLRQSISGPQIKRYRPWKSDQVIIYTTRSTPIDQYPVAKRHLAKFASSNSCPEVRDGKHPVWALHRAREPDIFVSPKFIGLTTSKSIELIYDESDDLVVTDAMYVFKVVPGVSAMALMAVMHSKLFLQLYRIANEGDARVIPQIKASKLEILPIPELLLNANSETARKEIRHIESLVNKIMALYRERSVAHGPHAQSSVDRQIVAIDSQIEVFIRGIYEITDDEVRSIEA